MSITIDRDNNANAIFINDANGAQFINNLQAFQDNPTDSTLSILDISRNIELFSDILYSEFEDWIELDDVDNIEIISIEKEPENDDRI